MYQPNQGNVINTGEPTLLITSGGKTFQLDDWWAYIDHLGRHWVVPKGFVYDLASIPPWLWWLQWGPWNNGAVLHDFAYNFGHSFILKNNQLIKQELSKKEADDLFADITFTTVQQFEHKNAPLWRIGLMHLAVSWFGRGFWAQSGSEKAKRVYGKSLEQVATDYAADQTSTQMAVSQTTSNTATC